MQVNQSKYFLWIVFLLVAFIASGQVLANSKKAGLVVIASGGVYAINEDGESRRLKRRSPFFNKETIRTEAGAKAQLRFTDGSMLSLRAETEIRIDSYQYDKANKDGDKSFYTLIKGGFRAITGAIGKRNPKAHRVDTPVATIGVRGTTYSAVLANTLYVGVWKGGVRVSNKGGDIDLGVGAAYNFAKVPSPETAPSGLMAAPKELKDSVAVRETPAKKVGLREDNRKEPKKISSEPEVAERRRKSTFSNNKPSAVVNRAGSIKDQSRVQGVIAQESDRDSGGEKKVNDEAGVVVQQDSVQTQTRQITDDSVIVATEETSTFGDSWNKDEGSSTLLDDSSSVLDKETDSQTTLNDTRTTSSEQDSTDSNSENNADATQSEGTVNENDSLVDTGTGGQTNEQNTDENIEIKIDTDPIGDNNDSIADLTNDDEASKLEGGTDPTDPPIQNPFNRAGIVIGLENSVPLTIVRASDGGDNGVPLLNNNDLTPRDSGFLTTASDEKFVAGEATVSYESTLENGYDVTWGTWSGSSIRPVRHYTTADLFTNVNTDFYWVTAVPRTPNLTLLPSGHLALNRVIGHVGGSNNGLVNRLDFSVNVDLNAMSITGSPATGQLGVNNASGDYWLADLTGNLLGNTLNLSTTNRSKIFRADFNVHGIEGDVTGVITGVGANAFAGGFSFVDTEDLNVESNPNYFTQGTFLVGADARFQGQEYSLVNQVALGVFGDVGANPMFASLATIGSGGNPIFVHKGIDLGEFEVEAIAPDWVMRRWEATTVSQGGNAGYDIHWGQWRGDINNSMMKFNDPVNLTLREMEVGDLFWVTAPPPVNIPVAGTGEVFYRNVLGLLGGSNEGVLAQNEFHMRLVVDYVNSPTVTGVINTTTGNDTWYILVEGTLDRYKLNLSAANGSYVVSDGVMGSQNVVGSMQGVLSGDNSDAITGVFDFQTENAQSLRDIDGVFLLDNTEAPDHRLSPDELAGLEHKAFAVVGSLDKPVFIGDAADVSGAPNELVLVDSQVNDLGLPQRVVRPGPNVSLENFGSRNFGGNASPVDVVWGTWNTSGTNGSTALVYDDPDAPLIAEEVSDPVNWITVLPTNEAVIANLMGSIYYSDVLAFHGTSTYFDGAQGDYVSGTLTSPTISYMVNFDMNDPVTDYTFNSSFNFNDTTGENWNFTVDGSVSGANLEIDTATLEGSNLTGDVEAVITGPQAEGIAGAFDLEDSVDSGTHVEGTFLIRCTTGCP